MDRFADYREEDLMTEAEITRLRNREVIMFHTNHRPLKFFVTPYFKQGRFQRFSKLPPLSLAELPNTPIEFVGL